MELKPREKPGEDLKGLLPTTKHTNFKEELGTKIVCEPLKKAEIWARD